GEAERAVHPDALRGGQQADLRGLRSLLSATVVQGLRGGVAQAGERELTWQADQASWQASWSITDRLPRSGCDVDRQPFGIEPSCCTMVRCPTCGIRLDEAARTCPRHGEAPSAPPPQDAPTV